jgi:hypothetical protein
MRERDLNVMASNAYCVVHRQRSRRLVGHTGDTLSHFFHHSIAIVLVRTAIMRCDFAISESCNHHIIRPGDVLRVLKHIEVLVFDLLTLGTLLAEVDELGVLFRPLDRLEELTASIGCFRGEIRRIVVYTLFSLLVPYEVNYSRDRRPDPTVLLLYVGEVVDVRFHGLGRVFETTKLLSVLRTLFRRLLAIVFEFINSLFEIVDLLIFLGHFCFEVVNTVGE